MQRHLTSPRGPSPPRPAMENPGKGTMRERTACNASTPGHLGGTSDGAQHAPAGQRQNPPPGDSRGFLGGGLVLAGEGSCHPIQVLEEESTSPCYEACSGAGSQPDNSTSQSCCCLEPDAPSKARLSFTNHDAGASRSFCRAWAPPQPVLVRSHCPEELYKTRLGPKTHMKGKGKQKHQEGREHIRGETAPSIAARLLPLARHPPGLSW